MKFKRNSHLQQQIYYLTYDKPGLNRRAFLIKKSLEEVSKLLQGNEKKK